MRSVLTRRISSSSAREGSVCAVTLAGAKMPTSIIEPIRRQGLKIVPATATARAVCRNNGWRDIRGALKQEAPEQQNAKDDHNCDNYEFDQRHFHPSELPQV